ncbi:MAG: DUF1634 domain-containing protein [Candidatus Limnocylindrales bacterium]
MSEAPTAAPRDPRAPVHATPGGRVRRMADPDRLRLAVSRVLTVGVAISAVLLVAGLGAALLVGWEGSLLGGTPTTEPIYTLPGLLAGLAVLEPLAIAQLGLYVLVLTPILRVVASLVLFAVERDRVYVLVSLGVLAILLAGLLVVR